jgi:hypothetical protein
MALGVYSASNKNEYQEYSWWVKGGRCIRLTNLQPSLSRVSRKCGTLNLSNPMSLHGLLQGYLYLTAVDRKYIVRHKYSVIPVMDLLLEAEDFSPFFLW